MQLNKKQKMIAIGSTATLTIAAITAVLLLYRRKVAKQPVKGGVVGSRYGYRVDPITGQSGSWHNGVDISAPSGTPIRAIFAGKIGRTGYDGTNGNYIEVLHGNGYSTMYLHMLKSPTHKTGQRVRRGEKIGYIGSTGRSTGPHLHLIVYNKEKKTIDPCRRNFIKA